MSSWKLIFRSLFHYRSLNLMVLAGVALTSAILSGALVVGDSVKESLRRNALARLSKAEAVLVGGERFFTTELADRLGSSLAPILQVEGTAATQGGVRRANRVQILGVDDRFWALSNAGVRPEGLTGEDWLGVNDILARRLDLKPGQPLICQVEIPGELSRDAPLSGESERTEPFNANVSSILGPDSMGRYSLRAEQVSRATVFLPLSRLQAILEKPGQANLILAPKEAASSLEASAEEQWQLADASLFIKQGNVDQPTGYHLLTSPRIFIDPETAAKAAQSAGNADLVLTYLANKIRCRDKLTPYSMIAGTSTSLSSPVPQDLKDDEIHISQWLADDLDAQVGDEMTLDYYIVETGRRLVEVSSTFRVRSIGEIGKDGWDQSWTPEFPGIFEVENLDSWEPGIPIDNTLIRDKDEEYWDQHRTTPKAFITLGAARKIFGNRFGDTTSIRLSGATDVAQFSNELRDRLSLGEIGITVRQVGKEARDAVEQSMDFGVLFASMSFFLILSALLLSALVFVFGIESRSNQIGLLLATGFSAGRIRVLFLAEAAILSILGASLGLLGGWIYTWLALRGMASAWREAASGIDFVYHVLPATLAISFAGTVLLAMATVWMASRAVSRIKPSQLIAGGGGLTTRERAPLLKTFSFWSTLLLLLIGLGFLLVPKVEGTLTEQGFFFGAGFCLTLAGVGGASLWLRSLEKPSSSLVSLSALGRQNAVRRKGRSLSVIGLMAAGVFMVTAINAFRLQGDRGANRRDSGTGGFSHVGEATLPIYEDLNSPAGREKYGLDTLALEGSFTLIPFRVSDGDDASCLNLNRAQRPRLLACNPALLSGNPSPFTFTQNIAPKPFDHWNCLNWEIDAIPAVLDMNTASYSLKIKPGDTVAYRNPSGDSFQVKVIGLLETSILQGNLIISETNFIKHFPDIGGYRFFLLDCQDPLLAEKVATHLTRMFGDRGLEMRPAPEKLDEFNAVQNTYLSIFSTLGGLGILLGTVGLAVVVGRNVMERREQLGLMQAIGFTRQSLSRLVLAEHWFLHVTGVLIGVLAALVAVLPKLLSRAADLPWGLLLGVNASILVGGLLFCWLAAKAAMRGTLTDSLRFE